VRSSAVMTRDVVVVPPELGLRAAAELMERLRIRHLPVVRTGELVGILSDRDLLRAGVRSSSTDSPLSCSEAMTPAPITCTPETTVGQLAGLMIEHKIDALPIVSPAGGLIGLVTSTDLLWLLADRKEADVLPFDFRLRFVDAPEAAASGG